jgi:hypothetical protein
MKIRVLVILSFPLAVACCTDISKPPPVELTSSPESLLQDLQIIYNSTRRDPEERLRAFEELFPPDNHSTLPEFRHLCASAMHPPLAWGLGEELKMHRRLFAAQAHGEIFSLQVTLNHGHAFDIPDPPPEHQGWRQIDAESVNFRLMFNPQDGFEVYGGSATFLFSCADGRWYINSWIDSTATAVEEPRLWCRTSPPALAGIPTLDCGE